MKAQNMKKNLGRALGEAVTTLLFLCLLVLILTLSGCGNKGDQSQKKEGPGDSSVPVSDNKESAGKKITITINNGALEDDKYAQAEQKNFYALWKKENPDIEVKFDPWQYDPETFLVKIKGGTATDIIGLHATEGTMVIEKGFALDLTEHLKQWDKFELINKEVLGSFARDGKIYGLPAPVFSGGGYVMTLFYNKEMFKTKGIVDEKGEPVPPKTWEEFVETAKKLTDKEKGVAGFGILGENNAAGWHFLNWVWQAGGDFEQKKDGKWKATFNSPEAINALQFIKDLRWKYDVLQNDVLCDNDALFELFTSERIGMAIFTPEYLKFLVEKYGFPFEKIGIALLPAGPGGRANQMGGSYFIINPNISKERIDAAIKFMLFHFKPEIMEARALFQKEEGAKILGRTPMIGWGVLPIFKEEYQKEITERMEKYRTIPSMDALMQEAVKYVHPEPPYYSQQLYGEALGASIQAVLTKQDADPAELLNQANDMFQKRFLDKVKE